MSTPVIMEPPVMVREIPLIVDENYPNRGKIDEHSGFPFDNTDREHPFRSRLDDLAQRHPEFAEHLRGDFPSLRSNSWGRNHPRRGSENNGEAAAGGASDNFRRFADRPFGSRFDRFGFPFSSHFDRPEFFEQQQQPAAGGGGAEYQFQEKQATQAPPQAEQRGPQQQEEAVNKPPQAPDNGNRNSRKANNANLTQSNTVDLGQKQEPLVDESGRNQRSMSAPPDNRSGKRFVSSIHIPINRDVGGGGEMGARQSAEGARQSPQQQPANQQQNQQGQLREHVIPIHVEGRDEPVLPKNVHQASFAQSPQPERVFGQKPTAYTKFVPPQQQQQQPKQQQQPQQQRQQPQPTQSQSPPSPPPQQQQKPPSKSSQIDQIQLIQKDVLELMTQVENFEGKPRDKQYLYLDEMLTRNLIKLDNIDTEGKDNIRQARKEAIRCIEKCISLLESKAAANVEGQQQQEAAAKTMEVEEAKPAEEEKSQPSSAAGGEPSQAQPAENQSALIVSGVQRSGSLLKMEVTPENAAEEAALMEVVPEANESAKAPEQGVEATSTRIVEAETPQQLDQGTGESQAVSEKSSSSSSTAAAPLKEKKKGNKKKDKTETTAAAEK